MPRTRHGWHVYDTYTNCTYNRTLPELHPRRSHNVCKVHLRLSNAPHAWHLLHVQHLVDTNDTCDTAGTYVTHMTLVSRVAGTTGKAFHNQHEFEAQWWYTWGKIKRHFCDKMSMFAGASNHKKSYEIADFSLKGRKKPWHNSEWNDYEVRDKFDLPTAKLETLCQALLESYAPSWSNCHR